MPCRLGELVGEEFAGREGFVLEAGVYDAAEVIDGSKEGVAIRSFSTAGWFTTICSIILAVLVETSSQSLKILVNNKILK